MAQMIESLKQLQVLKDHPVSKSFLTVHPSSCSWSHRAAFKGGHSSQLMTIFFASAPLEYCPTICTSLPTAFLTLISLLMSPALSLAKYFFYLLAFSCFQNHYKLVHPISMALWTYICLTPSWCCGFLLPCRTGAILHHLHNVWAPGLAFPIQFLKPGLLDYLYLPFIPSSSTYKPRAIHEKIPSSGC